MSEILWGVYKLFHDPPGTPKGLRCVGCKVASGGLSLGLAGACLYGLKSNFVRNTYKSSGFALLAFCFTSASAVAIRLALDDNEYNVKFAKDHAEQLRKERRENRDKYGTSMQQNN